MQPVFVQLRNRVTGVEKREGGQVVDDDVALLLNDDCDVYKPNGEPLLLLRRKVISPELAEVTRPILRNAALTYASGNRGKYAGLSRRVRVGPTGIKSNSSDTPVVPSIIAGYFDRQGGRFPFCRATAFTAKEVDAWNEVVTLAQHIAEVYEATPPLRSNFQAQMEIVQRTPKDYIIPDTPFSTLTVNHNIAGRIHKDKGDYKKGFGCISVYRQGQYSGGVLVFPEYRVGVDMGDRDLIFFNPHEWHAVTDFTNTEEGWERISVVYYYRNKMVECLPAKEELKRAKARGNTSS